MTANWCSPNEVPAMRHAIRSAFFRLALVFAASLCWAPDGHGQQRLIIMFAAAWDPGAVAGALATLDSGDFIAQGLVNQDSSTQPRNQIRTFHLPPSLQGVMRNHSGACAVDGGVSLILYDPEAWSDTPATERENLPQAIAQGADLVRAGGCRAFGVAPDGELIGLPRGECAATPSALARQIDWRRIDVFVIQAQRLLSDKCGGRRNLERYRQFVEAWTRNVKAVNPSIKVLSSVTFRYTDPRTMHLAISQTRQVVDGYYLAYPKPQRRIPCHFCSASNLESVIKFIKHAGS